MFILIIFFSSGYCEKFQLRQATEELYLGRPSEDVHFGAIANADIFELKKSDELHMDTIVVTTKDNLVLTVHPDGHVIYSDNDYGRNQKFALQIKPGNFIKIVSEMNKCISYTTRLIVEDCREDEKQNFTYMPVEKRLDSYHTVPVSRTRLEALKRAALECDEIKFEMGSEAIAELGETDEETEYRLVGGGLL